MRTVLAGELTTIKAAAVAHYLRVEAQDADGTWQDLTALGGVDWVISAEWGEQIDTPVSAATIQLRRTVNSTTSLAPLVQASTINRNAAAAYAPLLDVGRGIRISTATMGPGLAPAGSDYRMMWEGRIDTVDWTTDPVSVAASSLDGWLSDTQIESLRQYAASAGTAVETVMQSILTDNYVGGTVPTLYTPASPGWTILTYTQDRSKLLDALRALALQIGYDLRYRYDSTHTNRLTFYDPLRTRLTVDDTVGPTVYTDVTRLDLALAPVRNAGVVPYRDASGVRQTVSSTDAASVSKYRRRYFELNESINLRTATDAQKLADASTSDLAQPPAEQEIELLYYWPVQLYDRHTYQANGIHYDQDQTWGITGFTHRFENGYGVTRLQVSGKVVGAYAAWQRLMVVVAGLDPEISNVVCTFPSVTSVEVTAQGNADVKSWRLAVSTAAQPSLATTRAAAFVAAQNLDSTIGSLTVPPGTRLYVSLLAYTGADGTGTESSLFTTSVVSAALVAPVGPPIALINFVSEDDTQVTVALSGLLGAGGAGPLQYSWRTGAAAWSTFGTTNPNQSIPKAPKNTKYFQLQVKQADGQISAVVDYPVTGGNTGVNAGTGQVDPTQVLSGTIHYPARATDTGGMNLTATTTDSRTALLNAMGRANVDLMSVWPDGGGYAKVASGDVSFGTVIRTGAQDTRNANNAPSTYPKGTTNEFKDAGAIGIPGYSPLSNVFGNLRTEKPWNDNSGGNLTQTFTNSDGKQWKRQAGNSAADWTGSVWRVVAETQTQRFDRDTGHVDATMQDSRAALLNNAFRLNVDLLSAVVDGGGFRKVKLANVLSDGTVSSDTISDGVSYPRQGAGDNDAIVTYAATGGAGTTAYYYPVFSTLNYTFQAGDVLHYDVYANPAGWTAKGGIDFVASGTTLRDAGRVDQNGLSAHPGTDLVGYMWGKWYHRAIDVGNFAGAVMSAMYAAVDGMSTNSSAWAEVRFANVHIRRSGTPVIFFYSSGPISLLSTGPTNNLAASSLTANVAIGSHRAATAINSNNRVNPRNHAPVGISGVRSIQSTQPLSSSGAVISIAVFGLYVGGTTVTYPSGSITVGFYGTWYVYMDDPLLNGGGSYTATATPTDLAQGDSRVYVGKITVVSGGGGTGGSSGGGGVNAY